MTSQSPALVVRGKGMHFHFLDTLYTAKVNSEQTNGILTLQSGGPHVRARCDLLHGLQRDDRELALYIFRDEPDLASLLEALEQHG